MSDESVNITGTTSSTGNVESSRTLDSNNQNYKKIIIAVVVITFIILFIVIGYRSVLSWLTKSTIFGVDYQSRVIVKSSEEQISQQNNNNNITSSVITAETITYPERFQVPTENDIKERLISRDWDALITAFTVPGVITDYNQVSGLARFAYDNGKDITITLEWLNDSNERVLYDWRLNSTLDGYSASYKNSSGEEMHVSIIPHLERIDITIYDVNNAIKQLIVLT